MGGKGKGGSRKRGEQQERGQTVVGAVEGSAVRSLSATWTMAAESGRVHGGHDAARAPTICEARTVVPPHACCPPKTHHERQDQVDLINYLQIRHRMSILLACL